MGPDAMILVFGMLNFTRLNQLIYSYFLKNISNVPVIDN